MNGVWSSFVCVQERLWDFPATCSRRGRCVSEVTSSRRVQESPGEFRCAQVPYLPLDLPDVDEVLAELGGEQELPAENGECPGRAVPSPVREQAGAAVEVEHGAVPQLRAGVTGHYHLQRSRHLGSKHSLHTRGTDRPLAPYVISGVQCIVGDGGIKAVSVLSVRK